MVTISPASSQPGTEPVPGPAVPRSLPQWRALLERHWQSRLERLTELSLAYYETAEQAGPGGHAPGAAQPRARRLLRQTVAQRRALAEIEAALGRLGTGAFGYCEQCGRVIPASWLAQQPQARYCAACDR